MTDSERYATRKEKEAKALESVTVWLAENSDIDKRRKKRANFRYGLRSEEKWIPGRQI